MLRFMCRITVLFMVAAMILTPITAPAMDLSSSDVTDASIIGDFILCRPLGMAATIIGTSLFVVSLPLSLLGKNVGQTAKILVVDPAKFTFSRPLGNF